MLVVDLGIWPNIVETGGRGLELGMAEDWSIGRGGEEREILKNWTI